MSMVLLKRRALFVGALSLWAAAVSAQTPPPPTYPVLRPNGRLQADAGFYQGDKKNLSNGTEIRRARLAVLGQVAPLWSFQL